MATKLLENNPCNFKIVGKRKTKHGDFKVLRDGSCQVTINADLNPFRFLLTFVHEIAHLITYKNQPNARPHGIEWKRNFQRAMLPFLTPEIYPNEILPILANYLKNPKASTDADVKLSFALKEKNKEKLGNYVFELPQNAKFMYNNRIFLKGDKRRTRYECIDILNQRKYLFHQNALVIPKKTE